MYIRILLLNQKNSDIPSYLNLVSDVTNPVYIILFFILLLIIFCIILIKYLFNPLLKKHQLEEEKLRLQNENAVLEKKNSENEIKKRYQKKLIGSRNRYKKLSFYLQNNLEKEKQRIGMELHDSISQHLILLKLKLDQLGNNNDIIDINDINKILNTTIHELRNIMFDLKPKVLERLGLYAAVSELLQIVNDNSSIKGTLKLMGNERKFDFKDELHLFRAIQECINNVLKHSEARCYTIQFVYSTNSLNIIVSDDGKGFVTAEINQMYGNGLLNIGERIRILGGTFKINSNINGTIILISVPYEK